jgi:hypothetical protein
MSTYTAFSVLILAGGLAYCAYYLGWDSGFKIGKQRGWVNGYASAKQLKSQYKSEEVFDYEKQ